MTTVGAVTDLAVDARELSVAYGARRVLENVSFEVKRGEVLGLIGLNGVGKTTFIKAMLNLVKSASGSIALFGVDANQVSARRAIAYLPENLSASRYLKGREFIGLSLAYFGVKATRNDLASAASSLDLDPDALDRSVATYSRGMMQKTGLLATLLSGRPLLILDEPMTGLDPRARILLKDRLIAYREAGGSIFFSSHILSDIDEICDAIAVLSERRILYHGSPAGLRASHNAPSLERAFLDAIECDKANVKDAAAR
jgi:ABC-2 type transport system ATP-binding protein